MPSPIVPTWRITFPLLVDGLAHVQHFFLNTTPSSDASGYDFVARSGHSNGGVSTAMDAWLTTIQTSYNTPGTQFGNEHLDQFVGTAWVPVYTRANVIAPTNSGPDNVGAEVVFSGYSTGHERVKVILPEPIFQIFFRVLSYSSASAGIKPYLDKLFNQNSGAVDHDPWSWALSRNGQYFGSFVSAVGTANKHFRRKRGLG